LCPDPGLDVEVSLARTKPAAGRGHEQFSQREIKAIDAPTSKAVVRELVGTQHAHLVRFVYMKDETKISRDRMIDLLNEDLAREYQAIIAYTIYSQTLKGAEYNHIAQELEKHAGQELSHALKIAKQIDYFNGTPTNKPKEVKISEKPKEMLRFDLENERQTLINYRQRIRQADAMGEFALGEVLREIIAQEQEHLQDLADALGIDTPKIE
jgi:bacterioferritin